MESTKRRVAKLWKHPDGHACYVCKQDADWWLRLERRGTVIREVPIESPGEALRLAEEWRRTHVASA